MKVLLQKVTSAAVRVEGSTVGSIGPGYALLLGVLRGDTSLHVDLLVEKILKLRLFTSQAGKINDLNIEQAAGEVLVVSQFTLAGTVQKGSRPDYTQAEDPEVAEQLYNYFVTKLRESTKCTVHTGTFGAYM